MGKFSVNSIRGNENGKVRLGEGLLNDASKDIIKMRIVNLERDKIRKNPSNNYSINDIDSLAESIKNYGIASPLNVTKLEDDSYMLLGGERRITAIDKLIESFEGILDKFYQEKELDIATDISAMEILMKQDGLVE